MFEPDFWYATIFAENVVQVTLFGFPAQIENKNLHVIKKKLNGKIAHNAAYMKGVKEEEVDDKKEEKKEEKKDFP